MKDLWNKLSNFINDWYAALIAVFLGLIMIGGLYLQSSVHKLQINQIKAIHEIQIGIYKSDLNQTIEAGDMLYKVYQQEKSDAIIKDSILERQRIIIQQLIKQIEEYKKWEDVDPRSIA